MKKNLDYYKIIGIPFLILLVVLSVLLMATIAQLRTKELKIAMQNIDADKGYNRSITLISKFKLVQKKQYSKNEKANDYLKEASMLSAFSSEFTEKKIELDTFSFFETPAKLLVNTMGFLFGIEPIRDLSQDKGVKLMELAYFYERKRNYLKAVSIYSAAIKYYSSNQSKLAYNHLHRGFCIALLGNYIQAIKDLKKTISLDVNGEMGLTAQRLLLYIDEFNSKVKKIDKMKNSIFKAKSYYKVMAYNKAIDTFSKLKKNKKSQKLYFYRGRSYEELGMTTKAIADYKKVIAMNKKSRFARNANRRLYLLGSFYNNDSELKKLAVHNAKKIGDVNFVKKTESLIHVSNVKKIAKLEKNELLEEVIEYVDENKSAEIEEHLYDNKELNKLEDNKNEVESKTYIVKKKRIQNKKVEKKVDIYNVKSESDVKKIITKKRLTHSERKIVLKQLKQVDKIYTSDGNIFVGMILAENSKRIKILTVFGIVSVPQSQIEIKKKTSSKIAIK